MARWTIKKPVYVEWKPWFAWYPVDCEGERVWLEQIERKFCYKCYTYETETWWEYRFREPLAPAWVGLYE